jgi:hypothetical protein
MRTRSMVGWVVALVVLAATGLYLGLRHWAHDLEFSLPLPGSDPRCSVDAGDTVWLDTEQLSNAATIAAVGVRRGMPERAVVVALATALQESKLENLGGGDRDSVGLFQQRPSTGWGTEEQLRDPRYAARKFYNALRRVDGWEDLRVTEAAQRVQRSAYPNAYEKWADEAAVLAKALVGRAGGAVACSVPDKPAMHGSAAAAALSEGLRLDWGARKATAGAGATSLSVPVADARTGWRYAHWLVSRAADHGLKRVHFADLEWTADDGTWNKAAAAGTQPAAVVAEVFASP